MSIETKIRARRELRWHFLLTLYQIAQGNPTVPVPLATIGEAMSCSMDATIDASLFLRRISAVHAPEEAGQEPCVQITVRGIRKLEEGLFFPERSVVEMGAWGATSLASTEHFLPVHAQLQRKRHQRLECLFWVYQLVDGSLGISCEATDLALVLSLDETQMVGIARELEARGYLNASRYPLLQINASGIYEIEELITQPEKARLSFPSAQEAGIVETTSPPAHDPR